MWAAASSFLNRLFDRSIYVKLHGVPVVEADHKERLLCTVEIPQTNERPPQPTFKLRNDEMAEFKTRSTQSYDNGQLKISTFGTLTVSGNYTMHVLFPEGRPIRFTTGQSRYRIKVTPGSLSELRILEREIPSTCYSFDEQSITIEGLDVCGNRCPLDTKEWELELSETKEGLHQECVCTSPEDKIQFKYYFDRPGNYTVSIKPRSEMLSHVIIPEHTNSFIVVVLSPFDAKKSVVRLHKTQPINTDSGNVDIHVTLISHHDVKNREGLFLEVKVNGEVTRCYLSVDRIGVMDQDSIRCTFHTIILPVGYATIEIYHGDELIGEKQSLVVDGVTPFEIGDYSLSQSSKIIKCKGVSIGFIIGTDHANLNNMNRVLEETDMITEAQINKPEDNSENSVVIDMSNCNTKSVIDVCKMLYFLMKSSHNRNEASKHDRMRKEWKNKAEAARERKNYRESKHCTFEKKKYGIQMGKCNEKASKAIFDFYNFRRPQGEIDLHGQKTANEPSLQVHRENRLRMSKEREITSQEIEEIERQIIDMREQQDEAIRHLRERLRNFDHVQSRRENCDWLEVIVGAGHHSDDKIQKIRPKVENFLSQTEGIPEYIECNPGSLLIPFTEYQGKQPCTANFFCKTKRCHRSWESTTSWKGKYQLCYKCDSNGRTSKCYPFKMRSAPKSKDVKRRSGNDFSRRDHVRLCQVCQEQGRDCSSGSRNQKHCEQ